MEQIIGILVLVGIVGFVIYKQKPEVKDHCGKHEAFKKGCPICRGMNA